MKNRSDEHWEYSKCFMAKMDRIAASAQYRDSIYGSINKNRI